MKIANFSYPFSFGATAPYLPFGISRWSSASENQSHGATLWYSCMTLTSTIFNWSTRGTDRRTDWRWRHIARYSIMLSRAKIIETGTLAICWRIVGSLSADFGGTVPQLILGKRTSAANSFSGLPKTFLGVWHRGVLWLCVSKLSYT